MELITDAICIKPTLFEPFSNVVAAQSTRLGGISQAPYSSLNLGIYTADKPEDIQLNRNRFFEHLGFSSTQIAHAHQVHGSKIIKISKPGHHEGYDALITQTKDLLIGVYLADCTPILIYDAHLEVVAAIHAGWPGTVAQITQKTLTIMQQEYGSRGEDCYAYIGTCIDECTFEVDADVADHFNEDLKRWDEGKQKFFVDLKKANQQQLEEKGVPGMQIEISPFSTVTHNQHFFSHRKEKGTTGRMMAVIGMRR